MKRRTSGFTLLEIAMILIVVSIMATALVPLASGLTDARRANGQADELRQLYVAIVGDSDSNTFGYLGDVGDYPASLLDLVDRPASNPPGWNGPYISNVRIENGILYDQFGGAIEFFKPILPLPPAVQTDQVALISKGPDRTSTNTAANPNQSGSFAGTLPSASSYASASGNADNITFPNATDNTNLVNYQSLGQVVFNISNFDENANIADFAPGCPGVYDIIVSSTTHPTVANPNEAYMTYAPGGASVDLLQGTYLAKVQVTGSRFSVWQEQITVQPGKKLTKNLWLPGVNSSNLLSTVILNVTNNLPDDLQTQQDGSNVGGKVNKNGGTGAISVRRCVRINMQDATGASKPIVDSFIMPNFAYTKRYVPAPTFYTLTVTNTSINTVAIYDDGVLIGTAGMRGNQRIKTFSVQSGDVVSIRDDNNALVEPTFTMTGNLSKTY
jgi:hypothetical protein